MPDKLDPQPAEITPEVHDTLFEDRPPLKLSDRINEVAQKLGDDVLGEEFMRSIRESDLTTVRVYASHLPDGITGYSLRTIEWAISDIEAAKTFVEYEKLRIELRSLIQYEVSEYLISHDESSHGEQL